MKNLLLLKEKLNEHKTFFNGNFFIPKIWNTFGFNDFSCSDEREREINLNPYEFFLFCIEKYIIPKAKSNKNYLNAFNKNSKESPILTKNVIYSMLPRMLTAWDHNEKGNILPGTFLKAISLLPYLKKMSIDIIYLLPIFEYSEKYKKGEIGSPYSIKNVYKLDMNLHDSLIGDYSKELLDIEFKAFVEACHILGIKVMIDFVFRTTARDNDLIIENPEWFYWIDKKYNDSFSVPYVYTEKPFSPLTDKSVKHLYKSSGIKKYFKKFTYDPQTLDSDKWKRVLSKYKKSGTNILDLIEEHYGITTVPGFSDVLNDTQPPWSDVTFYKYYFDVNKKIKKYISYDIPPYILQDGIKANLYSGDAVNRKLWTYIASVIPYYQQNFGIDGARIDMGHALPETLNKEIIHLAKANNPNFIFWSEEFNIKKSKQVKEEGFHFINGCLWDVYTKIENKKFSKILLENILSSKLPVAAAVEIADTPRAALKVKNMAQMELIVFLNTFIPNAVIIINNGFEIAEIQPMNLGLANTEEGKFVLDKDDPMYGKLAFFDNYMMHWTNEKSKDMITLINKAMNIRTLNLDIVSDYENFIKQRTKSNKVICLCYYSKKLNKGLFLIANLLNKNINIALNECIPKNILKKKIKLNLIYTKKDYSNIVCEQKSKVYLEQYEILIGNFEVEP